MLTIFTPTYNRAHLLPRLYSSLQRQDCFDFEWLVIDDGSSDSTKLLFQEWNDNNCSFLIRYYWTENGGKQRAINKAMELAKGDYFFIVDSDDMLVPHAVSFIMESFNSLPNKESFIGISGIRGDLSGKPLFRRPTINSKLGYVDANNLERKKYGLQADMAEVFYTRKIREYTFPVWEGEKFVPEAVIWDQIAIDGYIIRWFDKVIYLCEYQPDGLTNSSWQLLRDNPMGYANLFNIKLKTEQGWRRCFSLLIQFISCCCLGKEYGYILKCYNRFGALLLFPFGWLLSLRRRKQISRYCNA